eukprot:5329935-Pyramimonas_sp.AAC.1
MCVETYPTPWFGRCCLGLVNGHESSVAHDGIAVGVARAAIGSGRPCPELRRTTGRTAARGTSVTPYVAAVRSVAATWAA